MIRELQDKQNLLNRVRSVQGHMHAVERMIEDEAPCVEILRQMLAVRGAMGAIQRRLWRTYLLDENCGLESDEEEQRVRAWRKLQGMLTRELEP